MSGFRHVFAGCLVVMSLLSLPVTSTSREKSEQTEDFGTGTGGSRQRYHKNQGSLPLTKCVREFETHYF